MALFHFVAVITEKLVKRKNVIVHSEKTNEKKLYNEQMLRKFTTSRKFTKHF